MRQASVGFHCPECVAEGARSVRQPRTVAGGLVPNQVGRVSFILIGINVLAFLAQLATGGNDGVLTRLGTMLIKSAPEPQNGEWIYTTGVADGAWWRVVTSGFLHFGFVHLLLNMYALYLFGPMLERMLGHTRFITMYAISLLGGSLCVYALTDPHVLTAGASGAVFGLLGCSLVLFLKRGLDVRFLLALLAVNAALTVLIGNVSWQAHLGGLISGALTGVIFAHTPSQSTTQIQAIAVSAILLLMMVLFVIRTSHLTA